MAEWLWFYVLGISLSQRWSDARPADDSREQ
jgi:hypothetical protein